MENLIRKIDARYEPRQLLVVYEHNNEYYIEAHTVEKNGRYGAGVPLQEDTIANMVEYFKGKQTRETVIRGMVPEHVLYCEWGVERKAIVWYNPPMKRKMFFTKELHIPNGLAFQPALIYSLCDGSLDAYAITSKVRPSGKDILLRAPYHNVSNDGSVCLGSASVKKPRELSYENIVRHYETMFWASEFSHLAGEDTPVKGNLNSYWKQAIKSGKPFDNKILIPGRKKKETLNDLIKSLTR